MKVLTSLLSAFLLLIAFSAQAQNASGEDQHEVVMYDPLFWKDQLKIKEEQSRKIEQINSEFYQNIRDLKNNENQTANNTQLERGLQQRSQRIFETLLPKQRRKLEKIIDETAPVSAQ